MEYVPKDTIPEEYQPYADKLPPCHYTTVTDEDGSFAIIYRLHDFCDLDETVFVEKFSKEEFAKMSENEGWDRSYGLYRKVEI